MESVEPQSGIGVARAVSARRVIRALLLVIALGAPLGFARAHFIDFASPDNLLDPFTDANTYLAAGERLNAGHELYRLQPGDRLVLIIPDLFTQPLVSPPPIAVIWRPIAAVPFGFQAWIVACWVALLGTVAYLVIRVGLPAALLALVLSLPIGEDLAVGNVVCFFPAVFVAAWRFRQSPVIGVPLGAIAAVKLAPIAMAGWLVGTRRFGALAVMAATIAALGAVSAVGAGFDSFRQYLVDVAPTLKATPMSLSGESGIGWLSYAALFGGAALAAILGRTPRLSFCIALLAITFGTPVVHYGGFVVLLALAAPLLPGPAGDLSPETTPTAARARLSGTGDAHA